MSKKFQFSLLVAIVVLAVAVIGLYFKLLNPKAPPTGQIVTSTVGVGGPPTAVTELSFSDGEVERFGKRELKMASGTSTLIYENRTGDDLLISNPVFVIPSGSTTLASSYVWVLATTTLNDDLIDESSTAISVSGADQLMIWLTATGTGATSTNATSLRNNHTVVGPTSSIAGGAGRSRDFPILLQTGNAMVLRIYNLANVISATGQGVGVIPATSTNRGFDPILKFDYESVD